MVGGLIKQQQIARAHQGARELQAHAPAAREAVYGVFKLAYLKAQPQYQGLGAGGGIVCACVGQGGVGVRHGHAVATGFGGLQLGLGLRQSGITSKHKGGG